MPARPFLSVLAATALAMTACSSADDAADDPTPTETAAEDVVLDIAPVLDAADLDVPDTGFAWQVGSDVVFTATSGEVLGHLAGWTLDATATARLAAPALDGPDGERVVVTSDGLVDAAGPVPVQHAVDLVLADGSATLLAPAGDTVAELTLADDGDVWVAAVGDVVGVLGGDVWDVTAAAPYDVEPGCRVADRHEPESPLLVCDDGAHLGGGTDLAAPDGMQWSWVTVGTTGEEFLATAVDADGGSQVHAGTRTDGIGEPVVTNGIGLFFRSSGNAWVARFGADGALLDLAPDGTLEVIADMPGVTGAAIWIR